MTVRLVYKESDQGDPKIGVYAPPQDHRKAEHTSDTVERDVTKLMEEGLSRIHQEMRGKGFAGTELYSARLRNI